MENTKKTHLIYLSIFLGLASGLIGTYVSLKSLILILPGLFFAVSVCIMLKFLLKAKVSIGQCLLFIVFSLIAYHFSLYSGTVLFSIPFIIDNTSFPVFFYVNTLIASLVGAIGICLAFTIFNFHFRRENIFLIFIPVLVSLITLFAIQENVLNNNGTLIEVALWQGAMMGALAYFTIRKMQFAQGSPV